jgi:hypothetical protein
MDQDRATRDALGLVLLLLAVSFAATLAQGLGAG